MPVRLRLRRDEQRLGDLLVQLSGHLVAGAQHLAEALDGDQSVREASARQLQGTDHLAESAAHAVLRALTASFVTPFDRADVYRICWALRRCSARMDAAADELALFRLGVLPSGATELVQLAVRAADVTDGAIRRLNRPATLAEPWIELTRLGKQGGQGYRRLLAEVTQGAPDPAALTRLVASAQSLRRVLEAFEDVADALQTVAVRES